MKKSIILSSLFFSFGLIIFGIDYVNGDCYSPLTENPWDLPEPAPRNLTYCSHYNKLTCCTQNRASKVDFSMDQCGTPSSGCLEMWNLYVCRFCSPSYSSFLNYWGKFKMCSGFADNLYSSCSSSKIQYITDTGIECVTIGDRWKTGKDFIITVFDNEYSTDDPKDGTCFNSARSSFSSSIIQLPILFLSIYFLFQTFL